jgi:hypothetical protein
MAVPDAHLLLAMVGLTLESMSSTMPLGGRRPLHKVDALAGQVGNSREVLGCREPLHLEARRALRQAWELDDADKAERLLRNLARRLDQEAPGVAASMLEGLDEMLTVNRLGFACKAQALARLHQLN